MGLLDGEIADIIADAIPGAGLTVRAVLIKRTEGPRDPAHVTAPRQVTLTSYAAQGIVADYNERQIDGTLILRGDRKIRLIANTIASRAVPVPGDQITIEGETYTIVKDGVTRDAARATYVCQGRR